MTSCLCSIENEIYWQWLALLDFLSPYLKKTNRPSEMMTCLFGVTTLKDEVV